MAARFVRASVCSCVRLQATLAGSASSRGLSTSRALSVRGTKLSVERDDERCAVDDDFYGISGDHGVVNVDNPLGDPHERIRRFSHLTRRRDAKVSDETVVAADFGTIRYDRDNRARYHGQYEDDTLLDELVLDTYSGESSKPGREAPDEGANKSELQDARETSISARNGARKKKRSRDNGEGATPVSSDVQNSSNAAVKLSGEVARSRPPRALPVDDWQLQLSKKRPSASAIEKCSFRSEETGSSTDSLARSSEQSSTLGSDHLESAVRVFSPAKATADRSKRTAVHAKEQGGKELSKSEASSSLKSSSKSFVTTARTAEEEDCKSSVSRTRTKAPKKPRSNDMLESDNVGKAARSFLEEPTTATAEFELSQSSSSTIQDSSNASQHRSKTRARKASGEAIVDNSSNVPDTGNPTAFEYVRKPQQFSLKLDSKGFFILKSEVKPNLAFMLRSEVVDVLRQRVLHDGNDVLILDKPYGMICHGSAKGVPDSHVLVRLLPDLSAALYPREDIKLYTVHRLDRDVTGAIVLAKTQRMADMLQTLFEEHNISKTYHAITFGVPDNDCATIDMPLAEGSVGLAKRMVICPKLEPEFERLVPKFSKTYEAVTHYRVLSSHGRAAYLEVKPVTGVKHQIRVHLGFGLRCPILGDHKYSHLRELAPQRLSGDLLARLNVRQTKVRHIPMHLHASSVMIPEILDGRNLLVRAPLPYHFLQNLKRLKLHRH